MITCFDQLWAVIHAPLSRLFFPFSSVLTDFSATVIPFRVPKGIDNRFNYPTRHGDMNPYGEDGAGDQVMTPLVSGVNSAGSLVIPAAINGEGVDVSSIVTGVGTATRDVINTALNSVLDRATESKDSINGGSALDGKPTDTTVVSALTNDTNVANIINDATETGGGVGLTGDGMGSEGGGGGGVALPNGAYRAEAWKTFLAIAGLAIAIGLTGWFLYRMWKDYQKTKDQVDKWLGRGRYTKEKHGRIVLLEPELDERGPYPEKPVPQEVIDILERKAKEISVNREPMVEPYDDGQSSVDPALPEVKLHKVNPWDEHDKVYGIRDRIEWASSEALAELEALHPHLKLEKKETVIEHRGRRATVEIPVHHHHLQETSL